MIHVLMLSRDTTLATQPTSSARRRHLDYAALAGRLTVVTYTPAGAGETVAASPHLTIIPTNSRHKLLYLADALRLGLDAARRQPVDLIVTQDPFTTALAGVWLRRRLRVPLLIQNHSYVFGNRVWLDERPVRNRLLELLGRWTLRRADFYRTVNRKERETFVRLTGLADRAVALPLGTASPDFARRFDPAELAALRAQLGLTADHRVVLWVGYPLRVKRVPLLLRAFARVAAALPAARLLIVGDLARSPDDLPAAARALGIADRVIMHGPVSHHELPAYYALGDVCALVSAYEGVPRVLFEAAAAGLPLVGMDVVGVNEVIEDGVNGWLVPDGDIEALSARVVDLLTDRARARALGEQARRVAFERYAADAYAQSWVQVWRTAVERGLKPARR